MRSIINQTHENFNVFINLDQLETTQNIVGRKNFVIRVEI